MANNRFIYDRVYLLGVDGAGTFFRQAETPNLDRIFDGGAFNHRVLTSIPTISAQCWGSMLLGVSAKLHRLTNSTISSFPLPEDYPFPSVYRLIRSAYPNAKLSSVCNWNPINHGIIEDNLGVRKETGSSDEEIGEKVIQTILEDDPKFLFVQFDSVDGAGHKNGYGTTGHLNQITAVDAIIGKIYDAAEQAGRLERTLFLVTADHGGTPQCGHGGTTDAEKLVSFFALGESVNQGEFGETEVRDIPAVVAYALGLEQPEAWSAHLPNGLFRDAPKQARKEESFNGGRKKYSDRANLPTPTGKKSLGNFIDLSHALCYYPLDDNLKDEITSSEAKANGKLYFTQGFYGSSATLDDCVVNGQGIDVGTNDFSFCAWIKKPEAEDNEKWCVFSTKDDENGCDLGFAFLTHQMELEARIGLGNETIGFWRAMPINYADNFFHFICTVSRKTNRIAFYYDFEKDIESQPERPIPNGLSLTRDAVHFGNHTPLTLDDLLVFDHALTTEEIQNLKAYYEQK